MLLDERPGGLLKDAAPVGITDARVLSVLVLVADSVKPPSNCRGRLSGGKRGAQPRHGSARHAVGDRGDERATSLMHINTDVVLASASGVALAESPHRCGSHRQPEHLASVGDRVWPVRVSAGQARLERGGGLSDCQRPSRQPRPASGLRGLARGHRCRLDERGVDELHETLGLLELDRVLAAVEPLG